MPGSHGTRAVRLLLKAVRGLPEREQQTVLAYLLERSLESSGGEPGAALGSRLATPDLVEEVGRVGARMLQSRQGIAAIADLYRLPEDAVRAALHEVAANPEAPQPLASILGLLAEGRSHAEAARHLGIPVEDVRRALEGLASSRLEGRLGRALFSYAGARARASHAFAATAPRLAPGALASAASTLAPHLGERPERGSPAGDPEGLASRVGRLLLAGSDVRQVAELYGVSEAAISAALHEVADHGDTAEPLSSLLRLLADGRSRADATAELGISEEEATEALKALLPSALQWRVTHALGAWVAVRSADASSAMTFAPGVDPRPVQARAQQMVPVRFPEPQYRRLKDWCGRHGFSMAVVVRGLVERFLDDQERRAA